MRKIILLLAAAMITQLAGAESLKQGVLSNVKQLTSGTERYENPQFSPDGTRIAFTEDGYNGLFLMDVNGGKQTQISTMEGIGYGYKWSADSRDILVRDTRWEKEGRVHAAWTISTATGSIQRVTPDAMYMQPAAWRYTSDGVKSIISLDNKVMANTRLQKMPSVLANTVINKNNANVSYITDCDNLYVVDARGAKRVLYAGAAFNPVTSPDGKKVAFNADAHIVVMNLDGTGKKVLNHGHFPAWVNNSQIVFQQTTDDGHEYTSGDLYMINIDGSGLKALTSSKGRIEMYPTVSPDGNKVVFVNHVNGQIFSADLR